MENSVPSVHTRPLRESFFGDLLSIDSPYNPWNSASTSPPLRMENILSLRKSYTLFSHLGPLFRLDLYFWKLPFLSLPIWILQPPHINLEPFSFAPHFLSATEPSHITVIQKDISLSMKDFSWICTNISSPRSTCVILFREYFLSRSVNTGHL